MKTNADGVRVQWSLVIKQTDNSRFLLLFGFFLFVLFFRLFYALREVTVHTP